MQSGNKTVSHMASRYAIRSYIMLQSPLWLSYPCPLLFVSLMISEWLLFKGSIFSSGKPVNIDELAIYFQ